MNQLQQTALTNDMNVYVSSDNERGLYDNIR